MKFKVGGRQIGCFGEVGVDRWGLQERFFLLFLWWSYQDDEVGRQAGFVLQLNAYGLRNRGVLMGFLFSVLFVVSSGVELEIGKVVDRWDRFSCVFFAYSFCFFLRFCGCFVLDSIGLLFVFIIGFFFICWGIRNFNGVRIFYKDLVIFIFFYYF